MDLPRPREWALYLRKSNGRAGIARQRSVTTAYIGQHGGIITAEFADADRTAFRKIGAARPEREKFDAMLAWLTTRPGTGVAAWHADRLARNSEDIEALIRQSAAGGHLIETPRGGSYDLATATGRKRLRDDATMAAYEVDHAIERITAAKLEAVAAGDDLGGRRRFGWTRRSGGEFALIPAEARLIAGGTRAVIAGASLHGITRDWNASGVPTSTGRRWRPQEVSRTLRRARNAGLLEHHGQVAGKGNWPPAVTEAEWRACRAVLGDASRRTSPGPGRRWLLSGIAVCGVCGGGLIVSRVAGKGRAPRPVYRCRAGGGNAHVARDAGALDEWVTRLVIARLQRPDAAPALAEPQADLTGLHAEIGSVRAQLDDLAGEAARRTITARQMALASVPLQAELAGLEHRLAAAVRPGRLAGFAGRDPAGVWEGLDLERRRAVIRMLVTVTVRPAPKGRPAGWRPGEPYFDHGSVDVRPAARPDL